VWAAHGALSFEFGIELSILDHGYARRAAVAAGWLKGDLPGLHGLAIEGDGAIHVIDNRPVALTAADAPTQNQHQPRA
jgi:hypothetical protein